MPGDPFINWRAQRSIAATDRPIDISAGGSDGEEEGPQENKGRWVKGKGQGPTDVCYLSLLHVASLTKIRPGSTSVPFAVTSSGIHT